MKNKTLKDLENLVESKLRIRNFTLDVNWKTAAALFAEKEPLFAEWLIKAHKTKFELQQLSQTH